MNNNTSGSGSTGTGFYQFTFGGTTVPKPDFERVNEHASDAVRQAFGLPSAIARPQPASLSEALHWLRSQGATFVFRPEGLSVNLGLYQPPPMVAAALRAHADLLRWLFTESQAKDEGLSQAYAVLGLEETATQAETRKRYRDLLKLVHPDKAGENETANAWTQRLNLAYGTISATWKH